MDDLDIIYNSGLDNFVKSEIDKINILKISKIHSLSFAYKYYFKIKDILNYLNIPLSLFINFGINDQSNILKLISVSENLDNFLKFINFVNKNKIFYKNHVIKDFLNNLNLYYEYKDLLSNINYLNISKKDISNLKLFLNHKIMLDYHKCPSSLTYLNNYIDLLYKRLYSYINKSGITSYELYNLYLELTVFNNNDYNILVSNIGGINNIDKIIKDNNDNKNIVYFGNKIKEMISINEKTNVNILKNKIINILNRKDDTDIYKLKFYIRKFFEYEANNNLTKINFLDKYLSEKYFDLYGVKTYDLSSFNYIFLAHVKGKNKSIEDLFNNSLNYISLSPISYLKQNYFYSNPKDIFLYDNILNGSYIVSSINNICSNNKIEDIHNVINACQKGILDLSSNCTCNAEVLLYRNNLKPVAICLPERTPFESEINYAKKYNLPFIITHKKKDKDTTIYTGRKILIFTDIHALFEPLRKIIDYAKENDINEIYSLGDNITVGPNPKKVLDLLEKENVKCVLGNSECYLLYDYNAFSYFDKERMENCDWTFAKLNIDISFLKSFTPSFDLSIGNKKVGITHFCNDIRWDYIENNSYTFQKCNNANQFLYTNSLKYKNDLENHINCFSFNKSLVKLLGDVKSNPLFNGKMVTYYDHIFEGHIHFAYENKLGNVFIHTLEMPKDDAKVYLLKEKNDGDFDIEKISIPFDKKSMMESIYSSDMPSKSKILKYVK